MSSSEKISDESVAAMLARERSLFISATPDRGNSRTNPGCIC
jgi:hypothetical protein